MMSTGVRGIANAAGNVIQASRLFGEDDTPLLGTAQYTFGEFGEAAAKSQAFRSNVANLSYVLARASEPGGKLSDRDVQNQINRLAANVGDQNATLAAFDEVERQVRSGFAIRHRVLSRSADIGPLPDDLGPKEAPQTSSEEPSSQLNLDEETDQLIKDLLGE